MAQRKLGHGTRARYSAGCRCARCRGAWALYIKNYRSAARAHVPVDTRVDKEIADAEARLSEAEAAEADEALAVSLDLSPLDFAILAKLQHRDRARRRDVVSQLLRREWTDARASA